MHSKSVMTKKPLALVVDDQLVICETLCAVLEDEGWQTTFVTNGKEAIKFFRKKTPNIVFLDIWMKGIDGIEVLQRMYAINSFVPIIIMSGHATIETAVKATKLGACDFLEKPLSIEKILPLLDYAKRCQEQVKDSFIKVKNESDRLVGESDSIAVIHRQIKAVAPRNSWVLITGENGTGKELVARNIYLNSNRSDKPFVVVNCAAIPETLIESELFGYNQGAFTHAIKSKPGKFELAHRGTLFLDEIGDMSLATQAKILRILQEQTFERLGDCNTLSVDVRVIAATNKDLIKEIKLGNFREDLFYRLNVVPIHIIPLRERASDILTLAEYMLEKIAIDMQLPAKRLSFCAEKLLLNYSWPGNVRELKNIIERVSVLCTETLLTEKHFVDLNFKPSMSPKDELEELDSRILLNKTNKLELTLKEARYNFEKIFIKRKLEENHGNISKTAEAIGVERSNLHKKLKLFEIDLKR